MPVTSPYRIGMIGYRFMGQAHTAALSRLSQVYPDAPDTELALLVGRDETALTKASERLGFKHTSTDWESALDSIDILYNLGPNDVHPAPSIAALDRGIHVLCEKPLAHTLEAAERMANAANSSPARSAVGFNYRFLPAIQYAYDLIEDGTIGDIRHIRCRYLQDWLVDSEAPWSWRLSADRAGSGALGDLGSHIVDLTRFLIGDRTGGMSTVRGHLETFVDERPTPDGADRRSVTVDDAFSAQVTFANGAIGILEASRAATGSKNKLEIEIEGTTGGIRFDLERLNELRVLRDGTRGYQRMLITDETDPYMDHWWPPGHVLGWEHTFVHENYAFLSAISNARNYSPSFEAGYRVQHILDAIANSHERRERLSLA